MMEVNASAVGRGLVVAWSFTVTVPCMPVEDDENVTGNDAVPLVNVMFSLVVLEPAIVTVAEPL